MDTSQIKRFAVEARNILKRGVINRISALGFDENGEVADRNKPQSLNDKTLFMGQLYDQSFYGKWTTLYNRVKTRGIREVYEEAAYTWFNRLMAIRIMEKNDFTEPVLTFDDDRLRIPHIVSDARMGRIIMDDETDREKLSVLLMDDAKTTEQFTMLITAFCHSNPVISKCFGGVSDYTEILLPTDILSEGGFVDMLNHTEFITDDDYKQSELIGWLYQFYISEKKDEVFASFKGGKKAEAEDIPAATQIFTPNWIVKYMVQNTVGRIYLDNNPSSDLKDKWKYLVEPSIPTPDDCIFKYDDLKELTMADLGCGSGHILNEGFDILYDIYIEEGYSRKQAIENIFKYNLTGVDIDTRAKQLATFALMMKACQKDSAFLDCHIMPNVLDMPDVDCYSYLEIHGQFDCAYSLDVDKKQVDAIQRELSEAFGLLTQAHNLGSIMKFDLSDFTLDYVKRCVKVYEANPQFTNPFETLIHAYKLILALTQKYASLVMNPPYMGVPTMNGDLANYISVTYPEGKFDLATTFVQALSNKMCPCGNFSFIIPPTWLSNSSFKELRRIILNENTILSLLNLSRGVFGADFGSSCTVFKKSHLPSYKGTYFRLVNRTFQEFEQNHLKLLFEESLNTPSFRFDFKSYSKNHFILNNSPKGLRIRYDDFPQENFEKLEGCFLTAFWASRSLLDLMDKKNIGGYFNVKKGMDTGNNKLFIRLWFEVSIKKSTYKSTNGRECVWVPYRKGGTTRKWYGNNEYLLYWDNDGQKVINYSKSNIRNKHYYFKESVSWTLLSTNFLSARFYEQGGIFDSNAPSIFSDSKLLYIMGVINSIVGESFLRILNPTLAFPKGDIEKIPFIEKNTISIEEMVSSNISISRQDWDAHETSWDFKQNELVALNEDAYMDTMNAIYEGTGLRPNLTVPQAERLQWRVELYKSKWETKFHQLHTNEEELNRQFIEIYGLQDELTPDVPLEEITILQQGEIYFEDGEMKWDDSVIMKQLISYAVGCIMGRYRLDKSGLHIAHPNPTSEEVCTYTYNGNEYTIDDDGIMPLMSQDCGFNDNGVLRFTEFVRVVFGNEYLTENLNYIESCLGKSIEDYLKKDFWKYHKKMYQNRPIYWLFSSKKGAFQVIAYMHRMNPYTVEQIRNKYLLPHIEYLSNKITDMELTESTLSTFERKKLSKLKADLAECQEYHDRLHQVADEQIGFDLDDGVVVNYAKFGDIVAKIK